MKKKFLLVNWLRVLVFTAFILVCSATSVARVEAAKSVMVNNTGEIPLLAYFSNTAPAYTTDSVPLSTTPTCGAVCGWSPGLGAGAKASVIYKSKIINDSTGVEIPDGATIPVGTKIRIEQVSSVDSDISWVGTGFSLDSPYGYWVSDAGPKSNACKSSDFLNTYTYSFIVGLTSDNPKTVTLTYDVYALLNVNPVVGSLVSPSSNLSCSGSVCTVVSGGAVSLGMSFPSTYGKFYYRYFDFRKSNFGCRANNVPLKKTTTSNPCTGLSCLGGSDYTVLFPTATVFFNFNAVVVNNPPNIPTVTPNGTNNYNTNTVQSFTLLATDPDGDTLRYGVDWDNNGSINQWVPSIGYVTSGVGQMLNHTWTTNGAHTFKVLAQDSKGSNSGWRVQSVNIIAPVYSCTGTVPTDAAMCVGDNTGLSVDAPNTVVGSCTVAKCEYVCSSGFIKSDNSCVPTQCNDGMDNVDSEDTLADMADPGCSSISDNDESNAPATASVNATDCYITAGNSSCSSTVTWGSSNVISASVRQNGIQFSMEPTSPVGGVGRIINYGVNTFTFRGGGVDLGSDTATASCDDGTAWVGGVCASPDIFSANLSPAGGSAIVSDTAITFSGSVTNNLAVSVTQGGWADVEIDWNSDGSFVNYNAYSGVQIGALATNETKNLTYTLPAGIAPTGNHRYRFNVDVTNGLVESDEANNRSVWVDFTVVNPPSINWSVGGCTIPDGSSQCGGNINWTFNDIQPTENYLVRNVTRATTIGATQSSGGTIQTALQYGVNTIQATANGISESRDVMAGCLSVSTLYNNVCTPPPEITITADPQLIRSGSVANVTVEVNSERVVDCTLHNVAGAPKNFTHDGVINQIGTYTYPTNPLQSKQMVDVSCTDTATGLTSTGVTTIEVIPIVQEI